MTPFSATARAFVSPGGLDQLRARSARLTGQMIHNELDLCLTMLDFPSARPGFTSLEDACRSAAAKAYSIAEKLLLTVSGDEREALSARLSVVRDRLNGAAPEERPEGKDVANPAASVHGHIDIKEEALTPRELEVLKYIAQGHSTRKVGEILGITFKTAACHRYRVMDKLGIHETASLVRYAIRHGISEA